MREYQYSQRREGWKSGMRAFRIRKRRPLLAAGTARRGHSTQIKVARQAMLLGQAQVRWLVHAIESALGDLGAAETGTARYRTSTGIWNY